MRTAWLGNMDEDDKYVCLSLLVRASHEALDICMWTDGIHKKVSQERLFVDWTSDLAAPGGRRDGRNTTPIHLVGRRVVRAVHRVEPHDPPPDAAIHLAKDTEKAKGEPKNEEVTQHLRWCIIAVTLGGIYQKVTVKGYIDRIEVIAG